MTRPDPLQEARLEPEPFSYLNPNWTIDPDATQTAADEGGGPAPDVTHCLAESCLGGEGALGDVRTFKPPTKEKGSAPLPGSHKRAGRRVFTFSLLCITNPD